MKTARTTINLPHLCAYLLLSASISFAATVEKDYGPGGPVAVVNGKRVQPERVMTKAFRENQNLKTETSVRTAMNLAVNDELLIQEALRLGYDKDPQIQATIRKMALRKFIEDKLPSPPINELVPQADVEAYYQANEADFSTPGLVRGRVIFVLAKNDDFAAAEKRILEAKQAVLDGTPFGDVVRKKSDDVQSRPTQGVTPWLTEGRPNKRYPAALIDALMDLPDNKTFTPPIKTPQGYFIGQQSAKRPGRTLNLQEASSRIQQKLYRERQQKRHAAFCSDLAQKASIEINPSAIKAILENANNSTLPPGGPVRVRTKTP